MEQTILPYCYFNKQIVPSENATLSIASQSVQYGMTCFAGIRGYKREGSIRIFRLEDHFNRLKNGAKIMGWKIEESYTSFKSAITELVIKNRPDGDFYLRPFLYTTSKAVAPYFVDPHYQIGAYLAPLGHYFDPSQGLKLTFSSWRKFSDASLPTKAKAGGCYINSALATTDAKKAGFDEALMLDQQGYVVEASIANIIVVYRDKIFIPSVGEAVLDGITMRTMVQLLKESGKEILYQPIDRSMVYSADELLLTGTVVQVRFADSVDHRPIGKPGRGPLAAFLQEKFASLIDQKPLPKPEWITEIELP